MTKRFSILAGREVDEIEWEADAKIARSPDGKLDSKLVAEVLERLRAEIELREQAEERLRVAVERNAAIERTEQELKVVKADFARAHEQAQIMHADMKAMRAEMTQAQAESAKRLEAEQALVKAHAEIGAAKAMVQHMAQEMDRRQQAEASLREHLTQIEGKIGTITIPVAAPFQPAAAEPASYEFEIRRDDLGRPARIFARPA